ncbi:unnamed protein product [Blepharisma stoltei]|uniref:Helicase ATP-binding domain-containing protein n=1 Tax=Blepharisma stoltei TaxID=1481888 RepID=A0AAU9IWH8_9CILI|nr:unnamed protein product [Blepharisma stoltei]
MEQTFNFPYKPYDVQLDLMNELYRTLDTKKVGIFESPTGTGKSLSIISSSFKWLRDQNYPRPSKNYRKKKHAISQYFPKIVYTSRTHLQLDQFISEIKKTIWGQGEDKIRAVRVGSRKQFCINPELEEFKNSYEIDHKCKEMIGEAYYDDTDEDTDKEEGELNEKMQLEEAKKDPEEEKMMVEAEIEYKEEENEELENKNIKNKKPKQREIHCSYFSGAKRICEHIINEIRDIEDLLIAGRREHGCPYYGSRLAIEEAEVIIAPYLSILNKRIRNRSKINLQNSILIIDEAHNLIESTIDAYSASLTNSQIKQCKKTLSEYYYHYWSGWSSEKASRVNYILQFIRKLDGFISWAMKDPTKKGLSIPVNDFIKKYSFGRGRYDEILKFIEKDDLARKVMGFGNLSSHDKTYFYYFIEFLECFINDPTDSCIIYDRCEGADPKIKYLLLNPIIPFRSILKAVRCIILIGGTIEPQEEFIDLFEDIPRSEMAFFSCGHVIPPENLLVSIVPKGKSGRPFKFVFEKRDDLIMMTDLCELITDVSQVVPNGIVVFLPSFSFLGKLQNYINSDCAKKIQKYKKIFYDKRNENILDQYSSCAQGEGAILFAVARGKLSEGINFSDELGRCIIMVGLPYLNCFDIEVKERINFLDSKNTGFNGRVFYETNCHKTINQSIGRAIRHANDYAVILLVDERHTFYKRPVWMRMNCINESVNGISEILGRVKGFFDFKTPENNFEESYTYEISSE